MSAAPTAPRVERQLSVLAVADLLGVGKNYVLARIADGSLKAANLADNRKKYRIAESDVQRFLDSRTVTSTEGARA